MDVLVSWVARIVDSTIPWVADLPNRCADYLFTQMKRRTIITWKIAGCVLIACLIPLGFWLDVMLLRLYAWLGWI